MKHTYYNDNVLKITTFLYKINIGGRCCEYNKFKYKN